MEYIKNEINESSLSRIWNQVQEHDSGTISAFRYSKECNGEGEVYTKKENKDNSYILRSNLLKLGYSVTKIFGVGLENYKSDNEIEVQEESYIVIDIEDKGKLKADLIKLGEKFNQDAITFQEKGGDYYLISSNHCTKSYPGFGKIGKEVKLGKPIYGKKGEFFSKVNGRPFVFESLKSVPVTLSDYFPGELKGINYFDKGDVC